MIAALLVIVGVQFHLPLLPGIVLKLVLCALALGLFFGIGLVEIGDMRLAWQSIRRVRIAAGPLAGVEGILVRIRPDKGLVVLSVDLLQRSVAVEVDCTQVVAA